MKSILLIAAMLIAAPHAEAGLRSCGKKINKIVNDPSSGIKHKLRADYVHLRFLVQSSKLTDKQEELFEEIQDCMLEVGSTEFEIYADDTKKTTTCRAMWSNASKKKYWRCMREDIK